MVVHDPHHQHDMFTASDIIIVVVGTGEGTTAVTHPLTHPLTHG